MARGHVTYADCEDAARHLHRLYLLTHARHVDPVGLAGLLRAELRADVPRGCRGVGLLDTPLRLYWGGDAGDLAHEIMHVALESIGIPPVHHPDKLVQLASSAIDLPHAAMRAAVGRVGFDAWRLMGEFPGVTPSRVFVRAAFAADGVAVIHRARRRRAYAPDGVDVPTELPHERVLLGAVRASGRPCFHGGVGAWPFGDGGDDPGGVVLLASLPITPTKTGVTSAM